MIEKTDDVPITELGIDHSTLTKNLARDRFIFSALRLQFAIWLKANGRVAAIYLAMVIGLILFWASGGLSKDVYSGNLPSLVTVAVIFWVIRLGVKST